MQKFQLPPSQFDNSNTTIKLSILKGQSTGLIKSIQTWKYQSIQGIIDFTGTETRQNFFVNCDGKELFTPTLNGIPAVINMWFCFTPQVEQSVATHAKNEAVRHEENWKSDNFSKAKHRHVNHEHARASKSIIYVTKNATTQ